MPSEQDEAAGAADRPPHVKLVKGRWYWDPPDRLRKSHNLKTKALGANTESAWALARTLNRDHLQLGPDAPIVGSVAWVLELFLDPERCDAFSRLAESTKGDYRWLVRSVLTPLAIGQTTFGRMPALAVKPRHADAIYAQLRKERGEHTAHYACRLARRVWKWAWRQDLVDRENPWEAMGLRTLPARKQRWTVEQVEAFQVTAAEEGRASIGLAVALSYWLSHREADVLDLTWTALDTRTVVTTKTGKEVPVDATAYPKLRVALAAERKRQKAAKLASVNVVVCEMTGLRWQVDVFRHEFRRVANLAGLPPTLQFRDLRATALTEMADAGVDPLHQRTHSGHTTMQMQARYARPTVTQFQAAAKKRVRFLKGR